MRNQGFSSVSSYFFFEKKVLFTLFLTYKFLQCQLFSAFIHFSHVLFKQILFSAETILFNIVSPIQASYVYVKQFIIRLIHFADHLVNIIIGKLPFSRCKKLKCFDCFFNFSLQTNKTNEKKARFVVFFLN